jgi:pSer/pThr/pTyr-binding forkhead associated (FHA) protein
MDVKLVVDKGTGDRKAWHLRHQETVIGRRRDCHLRILAAEVSRRHCLLSIADGYVQVEDLDSINGTFLNGQRVVAKQVIRPGDHLEIGPVEFIVEYELGESAQAQLAQRATGVVGPEVLVVEVLPLAGEVVEARGIAEGEEQFEAVEADTQKAPDEAKSASAADKEEPLAVSDDEDAADWHLPQTKKLRELLSQMEEPAANSRRRPR